MSGANNELFNLIKNSRIAQVAKPLSKEIRHVSKTPTHQIIFTPKSSALRSNFGLKTTLPSKIGFSHISYNDIDNKKSMPDIEKNSGFHYKQLMFKELGLPVRTYYTDKNPLFEQKTTRSHTSLNDGSLANEFNLQSKVNPKEIQRILKKNPEIFQKFNEYLVANHPEVVLSFTSDTKVVELLKDFLHQSPDVIKYVIKLFSTPKINPKFASKHVQGTGGFSYNQKGRLRNTPNGIKYGTVVPGRIIDNKEAAIAGFVANVTDRSTTLQTNYAKNFPGKHQRQFTVPFKVSEVDMAENGTVRFFAEGIKSGKWMETNNRYAPSNANLAGSSERNKADGQSLESLLNLILPTN
ncbi:MRP51 37S ribosomal protein MRP51 [Candida maltosa Xu316]|uniref:Uncharacterized protein n=1 Tax=Candida maltosa (strain Xu316) TaxID=1245528 RepID=M3JEZ9_CANMX|nr:hypothetical protein G210_0834 [Candida maltosa Xu316]